MIVYPKTAEAWALEMAQALGLGAERLDQVVHYVVALRAEAARLDDDMRAELRAQQRERAAIIAMKNEAIAMAERAELGAIEAAKTAHQAAVATCRIVAGWLLMTGEAGKTVIDRVTSVLDCAPLRWYADKQLGERDEALWSRLDALTPAPPPDMVAVHPRPEPFRCTYCEAPTKGMIPACASCGLGDVPEEERSS